MYIKSFKLQSSKVPNFRSINSRFSSLYRILVMGYKISRQGSLALLAGLRAVVCYGRGLSIIQKGPWISEYFNHHFVVTLGKRLRRR